jgi:ATP-dependent protease ClpP protease subunit
MSEKIISPLSTEITLSLPARTNPTYTLEYLGSVNYATSDRVLTGIKEHLSRAPHEELTLVVSSPGGQSGIAMSFYDTVRMILRPKLRTIAMGDVDSSGIIIFLSGDRRLVSTRTTLLLHPAGRCFDPHKRYTAVEIGAMAKEDELKDQQYAQIVARHSQGRLTVGQVLTLMECHTVLSAQDLVRLGLAESVLD